MLLADITVIAQNPATMGQRAAELRFRHIRGVRSASVSLVVARR